jgi:hypothetical protein
VTVAVRMLVSMWVQMCQREDGVSGHGLRPSQPEAQVAMRSRMRVLVYPAPVPMCRDRLCHGAQQRSRAGSHDPPARSRLTAI